MGISFSPYFKRPLGHINPMLLISILLIVMFILTMITTYLFPIYPDEIAVRVWLSRTIYDFPEKISIYPTCEGFVQTLPFTWFLPGVIEWIIHGNLTDMRILRLLGVVGELLLISLLVYQLTISDFIVDMRRGEQKSMPYRPIWFSTGLVISILSIGVLPFFLVTNRQEQLVLFLVALMLAIFVNIDKNSEVVISKNKILLASLSYLISASLILYSHPKGIFLSPFIILIGFKIFRRYKNSWFMALGGLTVFALLVQSYIAWKHTFLCEKTPVVNSLLKSFYIDPAGLIRNPRLFFDEMLRSLGNLDKYITQLTFQKYTDAFYLPSIEIEMFAAFANFVIKMNTYVMGFGILIFLPYLCLKDVKNGRQVSVNQVLLVLLVCILIGALLSLTKNWYDAGYLYVMLVIICVFIFAGNKHLRLKKSVVEAALIYFSCTAIFSQMVFNYRYLPAFLDGFSGPGISIKTYDYQKAQSDILDASKACNIDPVASNGVIFDDYTYFFFQKSQNPMAITYILYLQKQALADFIQESGSAGIVTRCNIIPKEYLPYVKTTGSVCCVPQEALKKVAKDGLFN